MMKIMSSNCRFSMINFFGFFLFLLMPQNHQVMHQMPRNISYLICKCEEHGMASYATIKWRNEAPMKPKHVIFATAAPLCTPPFHLVFKSSKASFSQVLAPNRLYKDWDLVWASPHAMGKLPCWIFYANLRFCPPASNGFSLLEKKSINC